MSLDETYSTQGPVCPYCGHMENVSDDPSIFYDESLTEIECGECEQTYSCRLYVSHSWTSNPLSSEDV
jgi:transcription elongation factor Elf1